MFSSLTRKTNNFFICLKILDHWCTVNGFPSSQTSLSLKGKFGKVVKLVKGKRQLGFDFQRKKNICYIFKNKSVILGSISSNRNGTSLKFKVEVFWSSLLFFFWKETKSHLLNAFEILSIFGRLSNLWRSCLISFY